MRQEDDPVRKTAQDGPGLVFLRTLAAAVAIAALLTLALRAAFDARFPDVTAASVFGESDGTAAVSETGHTVRLGGDVFGIRMFSDGVIVAGLTEIYTDSGAVCPARDAGIEAGDYVLAANGAPVENNAALADVLAQGAPVELTLRRGEEVRSVSVTPALCGSDFRAGMWIRDSAAGIGTVTFYSADGRAFAALGHGICDSDTKEILAMKRGEPAPIAICGVAKGLKGTPGRLRGYFVSEESLGTLLLNDETGIYGTVREAAERETVRVLEPEAVHVGPAEIVATVDGGGPRRFDVEIERVRRNAGDTKQLVVRVTDPQLLAYTGGIVQGMSGCPILQDGALAGALTHVFVEDPARGYGILAERMFQEGEAVFGGGERAWAA